MAGWPSIERADDQRLALALRGGDVAALAPIYDAYGPRLFDYCHVMLRDEETAAQAVQDSLIIVSERIATLPDPRLFRGWLYAVTRTECQRRRAHAEIPAARQKAAEADGLVEIDEATRRLVHEALLALSGQQREVLDLALRHELDPHELAEVLSVTPQDASVFVQQARGDLDDAFAAVVVAATGRNDCPSVDRLAGPPGAPLDSATCRTLARHISSCPICGLRANRKVNTARLLHAMPIAAVPADLRARVLTATTNPQYAELRATIAMRSDPPAQAADTATMPAEPRREAEPRHGSRVIVTLCGAVFGAALLLGGIFVLLPGAGGGQHNTGNQAIAAVPSDSTSADPSDPANASPSKGRSSRTPTPTPTPTASKTPKPKHTTKTPAPQNPAPPPPPPAPGTLSVSGCYMPGSYSCGITITAVGGPVNWSVTGASGPLSASGGGRLGNGESTTVTVRRQSWCLGSGRGSVSFSPNGSANVSWSCQ